VSGPDIAQYTFASALHRGFFGNPDAQAVVQVAVGGETPFTHNVPMMTPGDVSGISVVQVVRVYPSNGTTTAEPNYLALVEFDAPDLPWLFSVKPDSGPIQPWIALAVIDETDLKSDPLAGTAVGTSVTVDALQLPDPAEAWMFAHGQILGSDPAVPADPALALSRLISSRHLEANRNYLACVVPIYAGGRDAGLGKDPGDSAASRQAAWQPVAGDVTLPVYYWWRFGTGPDGDFESLVRRLHGVPLPSGMGRRRLRLDYPSSGMPVPDPAGVDLELHAALQPPGETLDDVTTLVGVPYIDALRSRLTDAGYDISLLASSGGVSEPPRVGPPVYGQLAAGMTASVANFETIGPPWIRELNLDPRLRVAAGLGAEVVRQNQDRYMESAWRQVGAVLEANNLRRRGEFSLAASSSIHRRWISSVSAVDLATATAPLHSHVFLGENLTVTGRLRDSPLPPSIVSIEYRRVTRARGSLPGATLWRSAVGPLKLDAIAKTASPMYAVVPLDGLSTLVPTSVAWGVDAAPGILQRLAPATAQTVAPAVAAAELDAIQVHKTFDPPTVAEVEAVRPHAVKVNLALSALGVAPLAAQPPTPPSAHGLFGEVLDTAVRAVERIIPGMEQRPLEEQITAVAASLAGRVIRQGDAVQLPGSQLDGGLEALRPYLVASLDPAKTILPMVNHRISAISAAQAGHLDDIMAFPDLSSPTYLDLAAISDDWLLPGVDQMPTDTTTLVESNLSFIDGFLVGVNHELARELLWQEYPSDQRGTFARQFWPHRDTGNPIDQYDLRYLLNEAGGMTLEQLGEVPGGVESPLVLVIKGDVVRRYPGLLVTAAKTVAVSGGGRALDPTSSIQPDFLAPLAPDVLLAGFDSLAAATVRAAAATEDTAWWFFLAEHFTEPRFGLDVEDQVTSPPADWNDASWSAAKLGAGDRLTRSSFTATAPKAASATGATSYTWAANAASTGWILLQFPFRRGMRATDLLPPAGGAA
jgi:hypothetical protein